MSVDRYAVVGNPIAHSRSPQIHAWFAEQTGQTLDYRAVLIEPGRFREDVERLRDDGVRGLNVTVPFKQEAFAYADRHSDRARSAGAVNTLAFDADGAFADNTDGVGLVRDLCVNLGVTLDRRRLLLLGAGGAARGALLPLLAQRPRTLTIANRTAARAQQLAAAAAAGTAAAVDTAVDGRGLDALDGARYDVIVNATSAGLTEHMPPLPDALLAGGGAAYDMMYAAEPTEFLRWARRQGAAVSADGLGMLVEQAAEAFLLWRGVRPPTGGLIERLRKRLVDDQNNEREKS